MPFEPAVADTEAAKSPVNGGDDKRQISAVVWVFLAVGAILIGFVVVLLLWKSAKGGNPFAMMSAIDVIQGVADVVGNATNKVQQA